MPADDAIDKFIDKIDFIDKTDKTDKPGAAALRKRPDLLNKEMYLDKAAWLADVPYSTAIRWATEGKIVFPKVSGRRKGTPAAIIAYRDRTNDSQGTVSDNAAEPQPVQKKRLASC